MISHFRFPISDFFSLPIRRASRPSPLLLFLSRLFACFAGLSILFSSFAAAEEGARARAVMVRQEPKIEGSLADPLWQKASPLSLRQVAGTEGKLATRVRVLFGLKSLFVAIECEEPDPKLVTKARDRDGAVWDDDCVEVYVLPHPKVGYKQIAVNPLGAVFDQAFLPGRGGDHAWNANLKVAVAAEPGKGWRVALAVPYKDLGAYAGGDQTWRLNATRVRKARGDTPQQEYSWAELPTESFQQPDAFGVIEHIDIPAEEGGVTQRLEQFRSGLQWTRLGDVRRVLRCFPHPLDPRVAWCATATGLAVTRDEGRTWAPAESATAQALGEVTCLAVSARDPETICLGTDARGLFLSTDGGRTWKPLGGKTERYASDHIEWVDFCPSDPTRRTLMATHGTAAAGMSLSRDLGATWEVFGRDRFLERFVKQRETIVAVGSMTVTEGKAWGIHRSGTDGQRWEETIRNIRPAAPATTGSPWQFFVATLDGAILHSFNDGKSWTELARSEGSAWSSLFFTSGPTEAAQVLAAYDPRRQGLCLSRHRFANGLGERQNQGLYVGPYVKSGATCAANANGTAYYIAMNNALWVGRWTLPGDGPAVAQAWCVPPSVPADNAAMARAQDELRGHAAAIAPGEPVVGHARSIAEAARTLEQRKTGLKFTVRAEVRHPQGSRGIKAVTADASKLGGSKATLLYDDGKHDDGEADDGVFGETIAFSLAALEQQDARETLLLTVKATDAGGASDTWPAVVYIPRGPAVLSLMHGGWDSEQAEGPVSVRMVGDDGPRGKTNAIRFEATGPGPWRGGWLMPNDGGNSAGLQWLTFYIKGDTDQDLSVHLMDHYRIGNEGFFDEPHYSRPVRLIAGGCLKAIAPVYQKVRIPIGELLPRGVYFLRWHTAGIALSAPTGGKPGTYHIDLAQLEP